MKAQAIHTGGGLYLYGGTLSDGRPFMASDCWEPGYFRLLDVCPDMEEEYAYDPDWVSGHTVGEVFDDIPLWNEMVRTAVDADPYLRTYTSDGILGII